MGKNGTDEAVYLDIPEDRVGIVTEKLSVRKGK